MEIPGRPSAASPGQAWAGHPPRAPPTSQHSGRLYNKLAGMTGTADTEAFEFRQIYGLDVVVI
ncbi:hypothetical protein GHU79_21725, partial [Pseudomonas aeruginosa]|nr:hypothetical protein [Pseudomonas aeruginosa]